MGASGYADCPMRILRRQRLIALFALVALFFATTAYVAHGFDGTANHQNTQCDLCLQFNGTAGAPAETGLVSKPPLVAFVAVLVAVPRIPTRRKVGNRLPRAPPRSA